MGNSWILLHQWNEDCLEMGVSSCQLDSKSGEDEVQVTPILEVP